MSLEREIFQIMYYKSTNRGSNQWLNANASDESLNFMPQLQDSTSSLKYLNR